MQAITRRTLGGIALAACTGAWSQGQTPVRITSVFPTGSGPDVVARIVAEKLQARWNRPVVMDAKPGGAGMVAINAAKAANPNGSELVLLDVGNTSINPLIFKNLSYDPDKDLVPVAVPGPVQQLTDAIRVDRARYAEVLKRVKVSVDGLPRTPMVRRQQKETS